MLVSMNCFLRVNANFWPVDTLSVIAKGQYCVEL